VEASPAELGNELDSLRVVDVVSQQQIIAYLPASLSLVDALGHPSRTPMTVSLGDTGVLISGFISLRAEPFEIQKLLDRAKNQFGPNAHLHEMPPQRFEIWILSGDKIVWHRDIAGGNVNKIPIQLLTDRPPTDNTIQLMAIALLEWVEQVKPVDARLIIDWKRILQALEKEMTLSRHVTAQKVIIIAQQAIDEKWAHLEANSSPSALDTAMQIDRERLVDVFVTQIKRQLLERTSMQEPQPGKKIGTPSVSSPAAVRSFSDNQPTTHSIVYKIRQRVQGETLIASIDLKFASQVDRSFIITNVLPITFR
jgi:hypothetical protein